ncbi:MAG: hypothetical protein WD512_06500, partial [Candidatus Paceibacterota bacterium]
MNFNLNIILLILLLLPIFGVACLFLSAGKFCQINPSRIFNLIAWGMVIVSFFVSSTLMIQGPTLVRFDWLPSMGINFSFFVDGLTYLLILFNTFVFFLYGLLKREESAGFYGCLLLIEISLIGLLLSVNLLVFYFFYE